MKHAILVALGVIGFVAIMAGLIHWNVRHNHVQPYFPKGMMVGRLAGVAAGLLVCGWWAILSWLW
jgi:hypothetical protein